MVAVECSKVIVVAVNMLFMVFGIAILALGIVFKVGWDEVRDAFVDKSKEVDFNLQQGGDTLGVACIVFGSFIIILSLMGCIGGCCRVKFLLAIYAIIVLIILVAQVAVVAFIAVVGSKAEDEITQALRDTLVDYKEDSSDDTSKSWSALFSTLECCGVTNYTEEFNDTIMDSHRTPAQKDKRPIIPVTCCKDFDYEKTPTGDIFLKLDACLIDQTDAAAYKKGCETKIRDSIDDNKGILIGVGVTIFLIEVIVVIIAFFLCCRSGDD